MEDYFNVGEIRKISSRTLLGKFSIVLPKGLATPLASFIRSILLSDFPSIGIQSLFLPAFEYSRVKGLQGRIQDIVEASRQIVFTSNTLSEKNAALIKRKKLSYLKPNFLKRQNLFFLDLVLHSNSVAGSRGETDLLRLTDGSCYKQLVSSADIQNLFSRESKELNILHKLKEQKRVLPSLPASSAKLNRKERRASFYKKRFLDRKETVCIVQKHLGLNKNSINQVHTASKFKLIKKVNTLKYNSQVLNCKNFSSIQSAVKVKPSYWEILSSKKSQRKWDFFYNFANQNKHTKYFQTNNDFIKFSKNLEKENVCYALLEMNGEKSFFSKDLKVQNPMKIVDRNQFISQTTSLDFNSNILFQIGVEPNFSLNNPFSCLFQTPKRDQLRCLAPRPSGVGPTAKQVSSAAAKPSKFSTSNKVQQTCLTNKSESLYEIDCKPIPSVIRKVNFSIKHFSEKTELLTFEIYTNGAISPYTAFQYARGKAISTLQSASRSPYAIL